MDIRDLRLESAHPDMHDVKGQAVVKRALEVAAVGKHSVLLVGPSGSGKSSLLYRYPTITPEPYNPALTMDWITEASFLHDVRKKIEKNERLRVEKITFIRPQILRFMRDYMHPLNGRRVQFLADMNFCQCGGHAGEYGDKECTCTEETRKAHFKNFRENLYGWFDMIVEAPPLRHDELMSPPGGEYSAAIRNRVIKAREFQKKRPAASQETDSTIVLHSATSFSDITPDGNSLLRAAIQQFTYNVRELNAVIRVARSIADLSYEEKIGIAHIAEAVQYSVSKGLKSLL